MMTTVTELGLMLSWEVGILASSVMTRMCGNSTLSFSIVTMVIQTFRAAPVTDNSYVNGMYCLSVRD